VVTEGGLRNPRMGGHVISGSSVLSITSRKSIDRPLPVPKLTDPSSGLRVVFLRVGVVRRAGYSAAPVV